MAMLKIDWKLVVFSCSMVNQYETSNATFNVQK